MEIYSAFNIKVNNTNREAGGFPIFCALGKPFEKLIHFVLVMSQMVKQYYLNSPPPTDEGN